MARKVEHLRLYLNQILKTMFLGGWVAVKAILGIAYSNQKLICILLTLSPSATGC